MHSCLVTNLTLVTDCLAGSGPWAGHSLSGWGFMSSSAQTPEQAHGWHPGKERDPEAAIQCITVTWPASRKGKKTGGCHQCITTMCSLEFHTVTIWLHPCPWHHQSPMLPCCSGHIFILPQRALPLQEQKRARLIETCNHPLCLCPL